MGKLRIWNNGAWEEIKGAKGDPGAPGEPGPAFPAEDVEIMVSAAVDSDPRISGLVADVSGMPTIIAGNYTKRLANYGGDLAAAIADLPDGGANGGEIQVDGEFTLSAGNVVIPNGVQIIGRGAAATRILVASAYNWPALYATGKSNVMFADMTLQRIAGGTPGASQIGVQIIGPGSNFHLERLVIDGFYGGVRVRAGSGHTTGNIDLSGLVMRDVQVLNTKSTYGIEISGVDNFVLDNCEASYSTGPAADGLKIGGRTLNGKVIGGRYNNNTEEGIDAFTGGQNIHFISVTCDNNGGSGIIVKTDGMSPVNDPDKLAPRNLSFTDMSCKNNGVSGLGVYKMNSSGSPATIDEQVDLANVTINGGEFLWNRTDGIYSNARNVTINGPTCRNNGRHGILVFDQALYNTISNPILAANGRNKHLTEGSFTFFGNEAANLWVRGKHVALRGGTLLGVDSDSVKTEAELNALTKISTYNVFVDSMADDVLADPDFERLAINGLGMQTTKTSGVVIFHYRRNGASYPSVGGAHGSVGSTYVRPTAGGTSEGHRFVKREGAPNVTSGWQLESDPPTFDTLPTASVTYLGWMVRKRNSSGSSPDTLHICVQTGASTYGWKAVTLT